MPISISYSLFFSIFIISCMGGMVGCTKKSSYADIPVEEIAEGDLVFRKGCGAKSRVVLEADIGGMYSHIGIVVMIDSVFKVLHITPDEREKGDTVDKVKIETFEQFFASDKAEKGVAMHWTDSLHYAAEATRYALEYYKQGILFDHDYDLLDSTKMYCTELVWQCYQKAGTDISEGRRSEIKKFPMFSGVYIFPSDIYINEKFKVYYSF